MKKRCYCKSEKEYKNYGARGIAVCEEWRDDYAAFLRDMGRRPSKAHTLDRIDVNGNYEKSNCKWATRIEQANNTRRSRFIEMQDKKLTVAQWARELSININTLWGRLRRGVNPVVALTTPVASRKKAE
jgi:hypothetical protein